MKRNCVPGHLVTVTLLSGGSAAIKLNTLRPGSNSPGSFYAL